MRILFLTLILALTACGGREEGLSKREAAKMAKSAGVSGNMEDHYNAGMAYCCGREDVRNIKKSLEWFCKGAKKGDKFSQREIGNLYRSDKKPGLKNIGLPTDDLLAYAWYSIAAVGPDREAADAAYDVAANLSFEELKKAKSYISQYPAIPCELKD